jgi:type II secretion system protein F domain protein
MGSFFTYENVPLIITSLVAFLIFIILLSILMKRNKIKKETEAFAKQLATVNNQSYSSYYNNTNNNQDKNIWQKWCDYWGKLFKSGDLVEISQPNKKIGLGVLLIFILVTSILTMLTKNLVLGLIPGVVSILGVRAFARSKYKQKKRKMDDQIPSFISAFKSNIQANQTPEKALIDAIDTTSAPLYDELKVAKNFAATSSFSSALTRLRESTTSKDLMFLCSCVQLAVDTGANLEDQLNIIEKMIEERKELGRLLDAAIRENKPLMYISAVLLPFLFTYMYLTNQNTRDFWFVVPISWLVFFAILLLYSGALFMANKFINNLEELR